MLINFSYRIRPVLQRQRYVQTPKFFAYLLLSAAMFPGRRAMPTSLLPCTFNLWPITRCYADVTDASNYGNTNRTFCVRNDTSSNIRSPNCCFYISVQARLDWILQGLQSCINQHSFFSMLISQLGSTGNSITQGFSVLLVFQNTCRQIEQHFELYSQNILSFSCLSF